MIVDAIKITQEDLNTVDERVTLLRDTTIDTINNLNERIKLQQDYIKELYARVEELEKINKYSISNLLYKLFHK